MIHDCDLVVIRTQVDSESDSHHDDDDQQYASRIAGPFDSYVSEPRSTTINTKLLSTRMITI